MTHDSQLPPVFRIDVSAEHASSAEPEATESGDSMVNLMREMVALQEQQNQLLEDLNVQLATTQRQRANELGNWKEAHPDLARSAPQDTACPRQFKQYYVVALLGADARWVNPLQCLSRVKYF